MSNPQYCQMMARYNAWQNDNLMTAADGLDDAARQQNRGAFFGSITATFSHLLWADGMWMSRFDGSAPPKGGIADSTGLAGDWVGFCATRRAQDQRIIEWAGRLAPDWFVTDLEWVSSAGQSFRRPKALVVAHLFNHQTHHRGQIHAMLTAAGARPGHTDLPFMPD